MYIYVIFLGQIYIRLRIIPYIAKSRADEAILQAFEHGFIEYFQRKVKHIRVFDTIKKFELNNVIVSITFQDYEIFFKIFIGGCIFSFILFSLELILYNKDKIKNMLSTVVKSITLLIVNIRARINERQI